MAENKIWKKFLSKHWKEFSIFSIIGAIAFIAAIYIFLWFVGEAQSTNIVPEALGQWSMGYFITFLLHLIFWEFVYIGIPILAIVVAIYLLWWKRIPELERKEYRSKNLFGKNSKRSDAGGGVSFLIFVFFAIKIYMDNNWGKPFGTWEFDYLVISCLTAFVWVAIVFGIPLLIGGIWWMRREIKKDEE